MNEQTDAEEQGAQRKSYSDGTRLGGSCAEGAESAGVNERAVGVDLVEWKICRNFADADHPCRSPGPGMIDDSRNAVIITFEYGEFIRDGKTYDVLMKVMDWYGDGDIYIQTNNQGYATHALGLTHLYPDIQY